MAVEDGVLVEIGAEKYRTVVRAGQHMFVSDEPGTLGGQDVGPDPYALLLASLGACKVMTVRMYADRKGWALERVEAHLRHVREVDHERIDVRMRFGGELTDEQRARLLGISEKCPVHKTITGDLRVHAEAPGAEVT